jgi:hypothetical protein
MKNLLYIIVFLPAWLYSQSTQYNFSRIDNKVQSIPFAKADELAKQLAALGNTDREKVRAIFRWITENIDYNIRIFTRSKSTGALFYEEPDDSNAALPTLNERIAAKVLAKRIAFCDGYSRLFKTLCDHAGIPAQIINGYARTNNSRRFGVNHTWNAVYIDSAWHLLDVTWASGFISYSNFYIRQYNDFYFLTPPDQFIRDHYPEDLNWTLLNDPPVYREYNQSPFRYEGYVKTLISNHYPAKGVIDAAVGDSVLIELKARREIKNFYVSQSPVFDSTQVKMFLPAIAGEKLTFKINIAEPAGQWLYVFCNEELVMRYRLNIKKDAAKIQQHD